jgi:ABC-type nitrate/sulfonate/bicarbonate transport system permease component
MADTERVDSTTTALTQTVSVGGERRRTIAMSVLAGLVLLSIWEIAARTYFEERKTLAPPTGAVRALISNWDAFPPHIKGTMIAGGKGWLIGNVIAIVCAVIAVLVPWTEQGFLQFAITTYSMPLLAIGPILSSVFHGDVTKTALAAIAVCFTTMIGTILGLRSADKTSLDLINAYGGNRFTQLIKVRVPAALPSFFNALRISAPAAILGAIIGDYAGGVDHGLGVMMVSSQFGANIDLTWAIALMMTLLSLAGYLLIGFVGQRCTPWATTSQRSS